MLKSERQTMGQAILLAGKPSVFLIVQAKDTNSDQVYLLPLLRRLHGFVGSFMHFSKYIGTLVPDQMETLPVRHIDPPVE